MKTNTMADEKESLQDNQLLLSKIGRVNAAAIVVSFAICAYVIYWLLSDPYQIMRFIPFALLFFVGIILFNRILNALKAIYVHSTGWLLTGLIYVANIIISIILTITLIIFLNQAANIREMTLANQYLHPVINQIEHYRKQTGKLPQKLNVSSSLAKIMRFRYFHNLDTYIIETNGSSVDMDGTVIYYLSTEGKWHRVFPHVFDLANPPDSIRKLKSLKQSMVRVYY